MQLNGTQLDHYTQEEPSPKLAFEIFEGAWSSNIPGFGFGSSALFEDDRVRWLEQHCGGFSGKTILELGPLEGGHTYMMSRGGAEKIVAIESNSKAFLKCLVVQNALKFEADFMFGDFRKSLAKRDQKFDLVFASGVLYHMTDPVSLLDDMAHAADSLCIWTHYYDPEIAKNNERMKRHLSKTPTVSEFHGRTINTHRHEYLQFLNDPKFAGGSAPYSQWMTRESLLGVLEDLGMTVVIGIEDYNHDAGPSILLYAARLPGYDEASYLARYPDVAQAVEGGQLKSGAEHYIRFGRNEGRSL
ncbi:class I SAM-dependent methyltransferase [Paraburkholderia aspalathi]|uniref:class I SAM-dependent methyltransferase n=1 Tax=Paraburkholderia aspalathi TaxID=1324617 RepID=UPI0038B7BD23